jgi:hypothetical protein
MARATRRPNNTSSSSFGYISDCGIDVGGTAAVECTARLPDVCVAILTRNATYRQEDPELTITAKTDIFVLRMLHRGNAVVVVFLLCCVIQRKAEV